MAFELEPDNSPTSPSRRPHAMRVPCSHCGSGSGFIEMRNGQACIFCACCGKWNYNAPKTERSEKTDG
jgi:hypothetical protein